MSSIYGSSTGSNDTNSRNSESLIMSVSSLLDSLPTMLDSAMRLIRSASNRDRDIQKLALLNECAEKANSLQATIRNMAKQVSTTTAVLRTSPTCGDVKQGVTPSGDSKQSARPNGDSNRMYVDKITDPKYHKLQQWLNKLSDAEVKTYSGATVYFHPDTGMVYASKSGSWPSEFSGLCLGAIDKNGNVYINCYRA
jgi:hypothetical protein